VLTNNLVFVLSLEGGWGIALDVCLAMGNFLIMGLLAWYGVSIAPPSKRRGLGRKFGIALLVGAIFTGLTIWRGVKAQEGPHIHMQHFQPHPIVAGERPQINLFYVNDGGKAADVKGFYEFSMTTGMQPSVDEEERLFKHLKQEIPYASPLVTQHIPRKAERWITATSSGPPLTKDEADRLNNSGGLLYLVGVFQYVASDLPDMEYCVYWNRTDVILNCENHNKEDY
jgi:uncharacterized membrane protein YedE/YeeE